MAASMSLDRGNTDKLYAFRAELQRLGIALLPPDVNRSGVDFTVEPLSTTDDQEGNGGKSAIRYALAALKNVGSAARSEEHTSELQSLMRNSYAVFCLKKKQNKQPDHTIQFNHTH